MEREILKKAAVFLRHGDGRDPVIVYRIVERERTTFPVTTMCRVRPLPAVRGAHLDPRVVRQLTVSADPST